MLHLEEKMKVFIAETAVVLEYWIDVSLFSRWQKPAVKLPWNKPVFEADIGLYAKMGIRNITSFAVFIDDKYLEMYGKYLPFLSKYGRGLENYELKIAK